MGAVKWLVEKIENNVHHTIRIPREYFEQALEMEEEQKHVSIDKQVNILKDTLEEMMTGFDSEEDRMDFILDICNGYRKRIDVEQEEDED